MSHTTTHKPKLLARVRRIRGQVEALERAVESDVGCADVLQLFASVRGAVNGLTAELIEHHLTEHVLDVDDPAQRRQGAEDLVEVIRTYLR